jgi:hypothetical protein
MTAIVSGTQTSVKHYLTSCRRTNGVPNVWSKPDAPLLIFSDSFPIGATLSYYGGGLAGAPDGPSFAIGIPGRLVAWPWVAAARALIDGWTKALF